VSGVRHQVGRTCPPLGAGSRVRERWHDHQRPGNVQDHHVRPLVHIDPLNRHRVQDPATNTDWATGRTPGGGTAGRRWPGPPCERMRRRSPTGWNTIPKPACLSRAGPAGKHSPCCATPYHDPDKLRDRELDTEPKTVAVLSVSMVNGWPSRVPTGDRLRYVEHGGGAGWPMNSCMSALASMPAMSARPLPSKSAGPPPAAQLRGVAVVGGMTAASAATHPPSAADSVSGSRKRRTRTR
jgi:hypothetical protein